jgi:hypothetical protein
MHTCVWNTFNDSEKENDMETYPGSSIVPIGLDVEKVRKLDDEYDALLESLKEYSITRKEG